MSKQQTLHRKGLSAVTQLATVIDGLKAAGPCPLDGRNAITNLRQQIEGLLNRFPDDAGRAGEERWSPGEYIGFMQELAMDCGFTIIDNEADDGSMECSREAFTKLINALLGHADGIRCCVALVDLPAITPTEERPEGGR
ncbi:hypothetical protein MCW82_07245 [Azospirillum doebereinerae]|uniref:hypothetical protein n=1 Tax=Azospirillum doebereinerae TaxID=92933 RepID=UPI001EE5F2A5|nr:hypothetical protein [Azospirillum doebereinerae]MCG5239563.1 hypothetical protein [Azospirillum doebereinerae]